MPRDSLDLIQQHTCLLSNREKVKKRTRFRNKIPDEWKSDRTYPADKPATYTPTSPGRDVVSGGYQRSEYQIQVHSRQYAHFVVTQREKNGAGDAVSIQNNMDKCSAEAKSGEEKKTKEASQEP